MASVVAIMICDYWVLTRGNVFVSHLYDGSRANKHYFYHFGVNIQAVIAYLVGIALPFPGLLVPASQKCMLRSMLISHSSHPASARSGLRSPPRPQILGT